MSDNFLAFLVANRVPYLINIYWVLQPGKQHWLVEIGLFYAVSGISVGIGTVMMGWLIRKYGMRTTFAFGANLVSALFIKFAARKYFIFSG